MANRAVTEQAPNLEVVNGGMPGRSVAGNPCQAQIWLHVAVVDCRRQVAFWNEQLALGGSSWEMNALSEGEGAVKEWVQLRVLHCRKISLANQRRAEELKRNYRQDDD